MTDQTTEERKGRGIAFWVSVTAGALVLLVGGMVMLARTDPEYDFREPRNVPLEGEAVPAMELPLLDESGSIAFDDFEGRVLVINFFASYCIPCRAEHGVLTAASDTYRDQGVQFIGVAYQDTTSAIRGFLDELGWGDGYLYVQDPGSRAVVEFGVYGVPETYFVDREGFIVHKVYGAVDALEVANTLDSILEAQPGG